MTKYKNQLQLYRHRMRLSQEQVVKLLGSETSRYRLSRFETGFQLPPLKVALALEILFRVPIAFCYPEMYHEMRDHLRTAEAQMLPAMSQTQGALF
jgi:transcriptional regulator with XRE-family HTH domain